jgi:hypothetical protein
LNTEDGAPLDVEMKTQKFLKSMEFESMVQCYARQIAEEAKEGTSGTVSVYLASDAAGIRDEFAVRVTAAAQSVIKSKKSLSGLVSSWKVEVDYFKASLPPAMYFLWTNPLKEMTEVYPLQYNKT